MGKSSIELTLKQLIDLGVINLKKKKRNRRVRRKFQASRQSDIAEPQPNKNEIPRTGSQGYSTPFYLPTLQPNSDSLRLRDDNQNLNTRLLEYNQQLANTNQEATDFQNKTKTAFLHVLNSMSAPPASIGYADDDSIGAFAATEGSDSFKSMDNTEPLVEEIDTPINYDEATTRLQQAGVFSNLVLGGARRIIPTPSTGGFASPDYVRKYERESNPAPVAKLDFTTPRTSAKPRRVSIEEPQTPNQPVLPMKEVPSTEFDFVERSARKPTTTEINKWKEWYTKLAGDRADSDILSSKRRTVLEPAVVDLLKKRYQKLGGANKMVLSSKDAKEIARNVEQLERLNNIYSSI